MRIPRQISARSSPTHAIGGRLSCAKGQKQGVGAKGKMSGPSSSNRKDGRGLGAMGFSKQIRIR